MSSHPNPSNTQSKPTRIWEKRRKGNRVYYANLVTRKTQWARLVGSMCVLILQQSNSYGRSSNLVCLSTCAPGPMATAVTESKRPPPLVRASMLPPLPPLRQNGRKPSPKNTTGLFVNATKILVWKRGPQAVGRHALCRLSGHNDTTLKLLKSLDFFVSTTVPDLTHISFFYKNMRTKETRWTLPNKVKKIL